MTKIHVGIIGASGYGAGELFRLLFKHPEAEVIAAVSSSSEGLTISELHPHLSGPASGLRCSKELDLSLFRDPTIRSCIFVALPHGHSGSYALSLFRDPSLAHVRIIDLSGDLRLKDPTLAQTWYPETEFIAEERGSIAYGLAELNVKKIETSRLIANPGCLASAAIYALAPLIDRSFEAKIIIDAKTGTSGAGRTPQPAFHHPSMHASCNSYKILEHRHEGEIREVLGDPGGERLSTDFVPTVIPTSRGIYVSCYVLNTSLPDEATIFKNYQDFYRGSPFIRVSKQVPELRNVIGSNSCQLYIKKRGSTLFIASMLDNLIKGMAGSAIQNMNICFGIDQQSGLIETGLGVL